MNAAVDFFSLMQLEVLKGCVVFCCLFLVQFEALEAVHAEEPFLLMTDIRCTSPWPVDIKTSTVALVGCLFFAFCHVVVNVNSLCPVKSPRALVSWNVGQSQTNDRIEPLFLKTWWQ